MSRLPAGPGGPDHRGGVSATVDRFLPPVTVLAGAFLLFSIEPLMARIALPRFGGSAEVWTVCLACFQVALLAGYVYARAIARYPPTWQRRVHGALLVISLGFLPVLPARGGNVAAGAHPLLSLVSMVAATVGLPFFLLSATSLLVQVWDGAERTHGRPSARLYGLSNVGSLLALLMYPIWIEPALTMSRQGVFWSWGYGLFVVLAIATMSRYHARRAASLSPPEAGEGRLRVQDVLLWFALAAVPSAMLLAVTQFMLRDVAAIPLLWVAPLSLYLLSLTLSFTWQRWYVRPIWYALLLLSGRAMTAPIGQGYLFENYRALLFVYALGLFVCCCVCHAELAAIRPGPRRMADFYLTVAAGGAAGSLLVAAVAPVVSSTDVYDLPLAIGAALSLVAIAAWRRSRVVARRWRIAGAATGLAAVAILAAPYAASITAASDRVFLRRTRTFYGSLSVSEPIDAVPPDRIRDLLNGSINHGREFTAETRRDEPLSYYTPGSGIGVTLHELGRTGSLRVGVVGLGVGTLAAYGRPGDVYRFYELDPMVVELARQYFWYLPRCAAAWAVVLGDARRSLEQEPPQDFDVLVVDAFTSDAIPTHLLTQEAFAIFRRHLKPTGVLALHVTNRYLDLADVAAAGAAATAAAPGSQVAKLFSAVEDPKTGGFSSEWVLVTSRPGFFLQPALAAATELPLTARAWTDDYTSLWRQLR